MNMKKKILSIRNREINLDDIDVIKGVNGGLVFKSHNGNLTFFREDKEVNIIAKELMAQGARNFLQLKNILINLDYLISVSNSNNDELEFSFIFEKNEEKIELSSREELINVGLRLDEYRDQSVEM